MQNLQMTELTTNELSGTSGCGTVGEIVTTGVDVVASNLAAAANVIIDFLSKP